ncbi:threonine synthase [Nanoarchaeota archaeon]
MAKTVLRCIECKKEYGIDEVRYRCDCGDLLEVVLDIEALKELNLKQEFDKRYGAKRFPYSSGVWRYKELILDVPDKHIVSRIEGNTNLYCSEKISKFAGIPNICLKHEGENPTGSFKDRGMTAGMTHANYLGANTVACASTGNTSASMASYAASCGKKSIVFIPEGKIAYGKLSQALAYGAKTLQIEGNFDDAMKLVQEVCDKPDIYLLNSINPFRTQGQKAILYELIQQQEWKVPDWIVLPGGNLGNNTAIANGLKDLEQLGIIDKIPKIGVIQAHGANPFYRMWSTGKDFEPLKDPDTLATAIKIGNPVNWKKSVAGIKWSKGIVEDVTEQEIMDAKAIVDSSGIGAEPASCATVAGVKKLVEAGVIDKSESVVGILTGNILKDPDVVVNYHQGKLEGIESKYANAPIKVKPNLEDVKKVLGM